MDPGQPGFTLDSLDPGQLGYTLDPGPLTACLHPGHPGFTLDSLDTGQPGFTLDSLDIGQPGFTLDSLASTLTLDSLVILDYIYNENTSYKNRTVLSQKLSQNQDIENMILNI